jgi:hypothetical protein
MAAVLQFRIIPLPHARQLLLDLGVRAQQTVSLSGQADSAVLKMLLSALRAP